MKKYILLFLLLSGLGNGLYASTIQRLGLEQGLSNNYVLGITQDKQGIMWIATNSGLNRFDGRAFKVFSKSDENSIRGNELNAILADPEDNLIWIATARAGLDVFNCDTYEFRNYVNNPNDPNSLSYNGITDLKNDSEGNIWIATYNGGVDYFDKQNQSFTHYNQSNVEGFVSNMVWSISDDRQGNLYIGHVNAGLSILSVANKTVKNFQHDPDDASSLPDNEVLCVYVDSYSNIWVGTAKGLALLNPDNETFITFKNNPEFENSISDNYIRSIAETSDKKLLVGTTTGSLNILDLKQLFYTPSINKVKFEHIEAGLLGHQISNPCVMSSYQDCFGNLWIGTYGGGVNFIPCHDQFFNTYSFQPLIGNSNSLSHRIVSGLCIDHNNSLWLATSGGIDVYRNNEKKGNYNKTNSNLRTNIVLSALYDSEGGFWFGCYNGTIVHRKPNSDTFERLNNFDTDGIDINCLYEDPDKNIWIGTNNGLHVYNLVTHESNSYYTHNSGLTDNVIRAITNDNSGNLWVGFLNGHVNIFSPEFVRIRLISPNNNSSGISHLYPDSKNRMWIATGENLFMLHNWNDNDFEEYGISQGFTDNSFAAVAEGNNGRIWCSTSKGITCLNPENKSVKNYNRYDGVPVGKFLDGSVAKSANGIIYFGSENGVCFFDAKSTPEINAISPIGITDFAAINQKNSFTGSFQYLPVSDKIDLKYNQNTFVIYYNILNYALNNQVEFNYKMEGLTKAWYNVKNDKEVTFRNLPPGKYTYHVKSRYKNQEWSDATSLSITIHPPFWLSWWAKIVYLLLILTGIFYSIRFYKNRLKLRNALYLETQNNLQQQELNAERLKFYTNITHELRTPLTLIIGPLEDLLNETDLKEQYLSKIRPIYKSAVRLLELINQILEFRKSATHNRKLCVRQADLSKQIRETVLKYSELNRNPDLEIKCRIEEGNFIIWYDPEVMTIVLDNLISNALKYTPSGEIDLSLHQTSINGIGYTEIVVEDTGYGIDPQSLPHIFDRYYQVPNKHQASGSGIGLSIVKNLIELHQADISVESQPEQGTVFRIRLLTDNVYPEALHAESPTESTTEDQEQTADSRPILLVVEDNTDIRDYISDTFSGEFEVLIADNGQKGVEIALSRIPDVIISDIMMPVMDGNEFCKKVKKDLRTSHIPFILLTAKDTLQDKTEGYTAGADSYITKPFSGSLLQSRVTNLLEARKRIAAQFKGSINPKQEDHDESFSPLDKEFIQKVTDYIEEHITDSNISIASVADSVYMSHSTLYRKIKALTGLTTNEFIRNIRIQKARALLATRKYNVSEVMYKVGISSSSYFRKCFKEAYGINPSEYQK